ncbi:sodium/hydrogen exchanger [Methylocella silvestris BL2]|uniref:Sodium/hydrogen exchanger n=1 Tax=Methylocella silvestris (strain DSM 15510 / CIP 108128 / LMG 27833 / NCIMB 13906 / BL2) TaxID=395965 RepID=B8EQV5_METSB|nr:YbaL family putative K(+) efflux transporter [Methylocella silvestris]ACK49376.1 sodium/hydrogen exchanger [Methylocella silvestris BL2]
MHHEVPLITTIAAAFGFALVLGFAAAKLKLPSLVGYLIAGVIIGPYSPGFTANAEIAAQLAEIGVMLLMFGVGLHFSLDDLWDVRKVALPGAVLQITVATALGAALAHLWGWSLGGALVFGLALSVASTVVLLKALETRGILDTTNGRIAVGWLIVEDLAMVLVLVLLPPLSNALSGGEAGPDIWWTLEVTIAKIAAFVALMLVIGRRVFPWLLWQVTRTGSRELFTLCVVAAAVSLAYGAAELFGVSFALGAFFAGMVIRESEFSHRAAEETLPLRDAFAVLFFVSVGMLFDPHILIEQPWRVLAVVAIIIIGKSLAAAGLVLLFRYPLNTALTVSASLAQIGEFSFILASLGMSLGLLPREGQSLILAGALISITLNSLVFSALEPIQRWIRSNSALARMVERSDDPLSELPMSTEDKYLAGQVVLVGYGRVGRRIGAAMTEAGIPFVVVDQNRELVEQCRSKNIPAVFGDAAEIAVLIQAHISKASLLVIATPDTLDVRAMISTARKVNSSIETVVRTHNEEEAGLLRQEKAGIVFLGEQELANGMTHYVLQRFGREAA